MLGAAGGGTAGGEASVNIDLRPATAAPTNDTCMTPTVIPPSGGMFTGDLVDVVDDMLTRCSGTKADITSIIDYEVAKVSKRLKTQKIEIAIDELAKEFLIERGYNPEFGARPLRRAIGRGLPACGRRRPELAPWRRPGRHLLRLELRRRGRRGRRWRRCARQRMGGCRQRLQPSGRARLAAADAPAAGLDLGIGVARHVQPPGIVFPGGDPHPQHLGRGAQRQHRRRPQHRHRIGTAGPAAAIDHHARAGAVDLREHGLGGEVHGAAPNLASARMYAGCRAVMRYELELRSHLFELPLEGPPSARRLTRTQGAFWPDVAPDGRTLTFAGYSASGYDIFVAPYSLLPDAAPRELTAKDPPAAAAAQPAGSA